MSKILKVSEGDYRVKVPTGNDIILDTGVSSGSVIITGNLQVQGQTTTIESVNATVKDNIIVLNSGDPGLSGISSRVIDEVAWRTSGIQIDRGKINNEAAYASLLFDEEVTHYNIATSDYDAGTFVLRTTFDTTVSLSSLKLSGIEVTSISNNNEIDIQFDLHNSNTYLSLVNSTYDNLTYEDRLIAGNTDPSHATNNSLTTKKYVNTYVRAGHLKAGMADVDTIYSKSADIPESPGVPAIPGEIKSMVETNVNSQILFKVNTLERAIINSTGLSVDTINLFGNTIKNVGSGSPVVKSPLVLQSDAHLVEVNSVLTLCDLLDNISNPTTSIANKTKIYSRDTEGPGRTGIFFTNNNSYGSNSYNNDELVSRNRAVLLSMLF